MYRLIGLAERQKIYAQLEAAVRRASELTRRLAIVVIHMDRFNYLNEAKGRAYGNKVLNDIGMRLLQSSEGTAEACMMGSSTFLVVKEIGSAHEDSSLAVDELKYAAEYPFEDEGVELHFTASIGVSLFPQDGQAIEELISHAEAALNQSLKRGDSRITFYCSEETEQINRRLQVGNCLRQALIMQQFHISFQPIYRVSDGRLKGFEALLRWKHPELGYIHPAEFIPIAEQIGLIIPIGEWVIKESCGMLANMQQYGMKDLTLAVNLSSLQLLEDTFIPNIRHVLNEKGLEPSCLEMEIKESILMHSSDKTLKALTQLRAEGIRIILDEYGKGYSSIENLQQLPINGVKISKHYIQKIDRNSSEKLIVEALIGLLHKLELDVIADGVEYQEQYELLCDWQCDYVQGLLLGQSMKPDILDLSMVRKSPSL